MMLGDIDTNGSLNAQIIHQLTDKIRGKMVVQVTAQQSRVIISNSLAHEPGNSVQRQFTRPKRLNKLSFHRP